MKEHAPEMPQGRRGALSPKSAHHKGVDRRKLQRLREEEKQGKGGGISEGGKRGVTG